MKRIWLISALLSNGPVTSHMMHWHVCETEREARDAFCESILTLKPGFKVEDMPAAITVPDDAMREALGIELLD
jgi:hypothetical protein